MKSFFVSRIRFTCIIIACFLIRPDVVAQVIVKPGKEAGALKLGMKEQELRILLKVDTVERRNYKEELNEFKGFDITTMYPFITGFDKVLSFPETPPDYPVFKMYFRNDSLTYLTLSSYPMANEKMPVIETGNHRIHFFDQKEEVLKKLGNAYTLSDSKGYNGFYVFYRLGIELTFDEDDKLRVVYLFQPDANFPSLMAARKEILQKEMDKARDQKPLKTTPWN